MPRDPEKPAEVELIRKRLTKLEIRVRENAQAASRARVTTAGLAGGAVALFLSLSVPWVRDGGSRGFGISADGSPSFGDARGFATGWEMMGEAFAEAHWPLIAAFLALLALLVATAPGLLSEAKPLFMTVQVLAAVIPPLLLFAWPHGGDGSDAAAGPGPTVVTAACVVIWSAAQWAKHDDSRFPDR